MGEMPVISNRYAKATRDRPSSQHQKRLKPAERLDRSMKPDGDRDRQQWKKVNRPGVNTLFAWHAHDLNLF